MDLLDSFLILRNLIKEVSGNLSYTQNVGLVAQVGRFYLWHILGFEYGLLSH